MRKCLFLVELPPPIHGMTYINQILYEHYKDDERATFVDLNFTSKVSDISVFNLKKIFLNISIILKAWRYSFQSKNKQVYYLLSMTKFGIIRDFLILLPSLVLRKKIFLHLHGSTIIATYNSSGIYRLFFKLIFRSKTQFIALGKKHQEHLTSNLKFLGNRIQYINNTIIEHEEITKIKCKAKKLKLLYISNLHSKKGILELLEVVKRSDNLELNIAGAYFDITEEQFLNKINDEKLVGKVNYVSFANEELKKKLFTSSDVFVLPSKLNEGSPISIIEAISYGLPVISTNVGNIPEMIKDCGILIEQDYSIETLAQAIHYAGDQIELYSENALKNYKLNYSNATFFRAFEKYIFNNQTESKHIEQKNEI